MTHRSRLYGIFVDTPTAEADAAIAFWSAALGVPPRPSAEEPQFTGLPGALDGLYLAVQAVDDTARFHVDIETDDVAAETDRLLALGAVEINRWLECRILRAPGGHILCVVPIHTDPDYFAAHAVERS